jgi:acyl-coenzyme A thioesterase PaaI-like protein
VGFHHRYPGAANTPTRGPARGGAPIPGPPSAPHGGIQATLLDEVMGTTAHTAFAEHVSGSLVTAEFSLRYRRPVPVEAPIVVFGELRRVDGRNYFVDARIESVAGETLTVADARWCLLNGSV